MKRVSRHRRKGTGKPQDAHDRNNQTCASIILANPERYPGLMTEWALMIVQCKPETTGMEASGRTRMFAA